MLFILVIILHLIVNRTLLINTLMFTLVGSIPFIELIKIVNGQVSIDRIGATWLSSDICMTRPIFIYEK